jgi:uncharacterized protein YdaU (DUF1376 family)
MNFYPFHIGDYISHTSHLTDAEDLAYRRLIDLYYQTEAPLPHDLTLLARKVKSTVDIVDLILNEFFEFVDGAWHSARADKEIAKYQYLSQSGKKGAEKRWANRDGKLSDSQPNSPPIATPIATKNQEPLTKNHIKTITPSGVSDSVFQDFVKLRKGLKAPVTETAIKGLEREAKKAGMTLEAVMSLCCQNGWRGFKAEWIKDKAQGNKNSQVLSGLTRGLIGGGNDVGIF